MIEALHDLEQMRVEIRMACDVPGCGRTDRFFGSTIDEAHDTLKASAWRRDHLLTVTGSRQKFVGADPTDIEIVTRQIRVDACPDCAASNAQRVGD